MDGVLLENLPAEITNASTVRGILLPCTEAT